MRGARNHGPMNETMTSHTTCTTTHAQYYNMICEDFRNINLYDNPESSLAGARKAIRDYRKAYPAGTTKFRILIESMQRTQVDIDYPLTVH